MEHHEVPGHPLKPALDAVFRLLRLGLTGFRRPCTASACTDHKDEDGGKKAGGSRFHAGILAVCHVNLSVAQRAKEEDSGMMPPGGDVPALHKLDAAFHPITSWK